MKAVITNIITLLATVPFGATLNLITEDLHTATLIRRVIDSPQHKIEQANTQHLYIYILSMKLIIQKKGLKMRTTNGVAPKIEKQTPPSPVEVMTKKLLTRTYTPKMQNHVFPHNPRR